MPKTSTPNPGTQVPAVPDSPRAPAAAAPLRPSTAGAAIVEQALERSRDVKEQVEACAADLGVVNAVVKKEIVEGAIGLATHDALACSEAIEGKVQASADELHQVNESLAEGIIELKRTRHTLDLYKQALAQSDEALAQSRASELRVQQLAFIDATTGLSNRALFDDRLSQAISLADRNQWALAILYFDLDQFKMINDTYGHAAGDRVLKQVANRLQSHCRDTDTLCRHGGDEFLYLLMNPQDRDDIARVAAAVISDIAKPIEYGTVMLTVKTSVGISLYPEHSVDAAELIGQADTAMYRAKREASGFSFF